MQFYQRKQSNAIDQPLETRVINDTVFIISSNPNVLYHQLHFNNFFTNYHLITELAKKSMQATQTIRRNEGANRQLVQNKELQKKERGTCNYCIDGNVYSVKCHNNSAVNSGSNWETMNLCEK